MTASYTFANTTNVALTKHFQCVTVMVTMYDQVNKEPRQTDLETTGHEGKIKIPQ